MRKFNLCMIIALAVAVLASLTFSQVSSAAAQQEPPVGVVIAYTPGQSITIVDQRGTEHQYTISTNLKILPPGRANSLAVGSFVTIIAPASLNQGKQTAVGIVVHPNIPNGWNVPSAAATPLAPDTPTPIGTSSATETAPVTVTGTQLATETMTETATATPILEGTPSETPTATPTPPGGTATATTEGFVEWLRSLFSQILSSR